MTSSSFRASASRALSTACPVPSRSRWMKISTLAWRAASWDTRSLSGPTTTAIRGWLADERADVQVEVHRGGQPLYPYLFGAE